MRNQYDMHLSAQAIAPATIQLLESSGFVKDYFQNNRNSEPPHYHASYRTHFEEPNDELWHSTVRLLLADPSFRGCLEEEAFGEKRLVFDTRASAAGLPAPIRPFELEQCQPGEHKACDVHINIDLGLTTPQGLAELERFNFVSFEREVDGILRRIYSLTFEDLEMGTAVFARLGELFEAIPGLVGKMKLEEVTRFLVHPEDAAQLPIVRTTFACGWLA